MANVNVQSWNLSSDEEALLRATDDTFHWLCNLPASVRDNVSGKWVAAKDCQIVDAADTLDALMQRLGDIDLGSVIIDRIEKPAWVVYR